MNEISLILEEVKRTNGNLSKVARDLGVEYYALKQRLAPPPVESCQPALGPEPADIRTLGRPGFEKYVIAVKKQGQSWPVKYDKVLKEARRKFDAGTHEMFQTPNEGWVVQYLIPRLRPVSRRNFFASLP